MTAIDPPPLTLAFSPCPNDTFMFHALVAGLVAADGLRFAPTLLDIEELNARALSPTAGFDVTKLSVATFAAVRARYVLLDAGAALGSGNGPLVVRAAARDDVCDLDALAGRRVAIPGVHTTAALLLRRYAPASVRPVPMRFDRIAKAVADGTVEAGVIIHETRFTYRDAGLVAVADLGEHWEAAERIPLPLGVVAARASLGPERIAAIERGLRASVEHAQREPRASADYVRRHAQELSPEVCAQHIALYVNEYSVSLGARGRAAIAAMLAGDAPTE
ncbi:MAG: 1,4-dihydroxy-6-naphthoate synthase [Phycisphaerales bacterium]|nr:1,4-dihydroxy-6-naphthoate synthase [Phycisphaerales bacterium]